MTEPVARCSMCRGEGLVKGPRKCPACRGIGVVATMNNVLPIRPLVKAKPRVATEHYPQTRDGVDLVRDGAHDRLSHQRDGRSFQVWLTREEVSLVHRLSGLLLKEDGEWQT